MAQNYIYLIIHGNSEMGCQTSVATCMLNAGQSLKAIADMLGHRDVNSTFIYTKVDFETLKKLPLDWPEV